MKNKNEKCCKKMNGKNIFIGLLMGLAILIFGGKAILSQMNTPTPQVLDTTQLDQLLERNEEAVTVEFNGTWTTEGEETLTLNEDGTVSGMEGVTTWSAEGSTLTFVKEDETTMTAELVEDMLDIDGVVYKK